MKKMPIRIALLAACGFAVVVFVFAGLQAEAENPTGAVEGAAPADSDRTTTTATTALVTTTMPEPVAVSNPDLVTETTHVQYEIVTQPDYDTDFVISEIPEGLVDFPSEPIDPSPPGLVVFEADEPMDPVRIEIESAGSIHERDLFVTANYPAASLLADALVSPAYEVIFPNALEQFIVTAELTIPYRSDFVNDSDPADLRIAVFDPATDVWRVAPGDHVHDLERREITVAVAGFTSFAVIRFPTTERLHEHQEANAGRWD